MEYHHTWSDYNNGGFFFGEEVLRLNGLKVPYRYLKWVMEFKVIYWFFFIIISV